MRTVAQVPARAPHRVCSKRVCADMATESVAAADTEASAGAGSADVSVQASLASTGTVPSQAASSGRAKARKKVGKVVNGQARSSATQVDGGDAQGGVSGKPGPQNVRQELRGLPTSALKNFSMAQRLPLSLIVLSAHGSLNVGNLLRAAQLSGVQRAWVTGRRRYDRRSAVGADYYMQVTRVLADLCYDFTEEEAQSISLVNNLTEEERRHPLDVGTFVELLRSSRLLPVFLETADAGLGPERTAFDDAVPWKRWMGELPPGYELCLVVGNEMTGVPQELIQAAAAEGPGAFVLAVRQLGAVKSHNVSVAGAVVMADFRRFYVRDRLGHWLDFDRNIV